MSAREEAVAELVQTSFELATSVSASAYSRTASYQHFISRRRLERVLLALDELVDAGDARDVIRARLAAIEEGRRA